MSEQTYLEMTSVIQLHPSQSSQSVVLAPIRGQVVRQLTMAVGRDFGWPSQRWNDREWDDYLAVPPMKHWMGMVESKPIGILSLNLVQAPEVELDAFGLLPDQIGHGLGGPFLTEAVRLAWAQPAGRIWLHTSSDDHPHALSNYLARGFTRYQP